MHENRSKYVFQRLDMYLQPIEYTRLLCSPSLTSSADDEAVEVLPPSLLMHLISRSIRSASSSNSFGLITGSADGELVLTGDGLLPVNLLDDNCVDNSDLPGDIPDTVDRDEEEIES